MKPFLETLVFTILIPGSFVIVLPIFIGLASRSQPFAGYSAAGPFLILAGAMIYIWAATAFVREGEGTPSPTAPPLKFVALGPYRYVRNPIYVGELIVIIGIAAIYGSALVLFYASGLFAILFLFIVGYEEPDLMRRFGSAYEDYVREVGRWLPLRYLLRRKSEKE